MKKYVVEYLKTYKLKKRARRTYEAEKGRLNSLLSFFSRLKITQPYEVTKEIMISWSFEMSRQKLAALTIHYRKQSAQRFFLWLYKEGYFLVNPFPEEIIGKKPSAGVRLSPSIEEIDQALQIAENAKFHPFRSRAILELAYCCGLRVSEIRKLNAADIKGDSLRILGKGNKERLVPLSIGVKKILQRYIDTERREILLKKNPFEEALILSRGGKRLGSGSYDMTLRASLKLELTLHQLRHACATHMLKNGCPTLVLQKLLGHEDPYTTTIYAQVDNELLHDLLKRFHPRG